MMCWVAQYAERELHALYELNTILYIPFQRLLSSDVLVVMV